MMERKARENYLGIGGWFWGGNYRLERYLYILHRVTGFGILAYGAIHLIVMTIFRLQGQSFYEAVMRLFANPAFTVGEYLVFAAFIIHSANGFRLMLQELGFLLGRPVPPIYPYRDALQKKRLIVTALVAVMVVLLAVVLFDFVV